MPMTDEEKLEQNKRGVILLTIFSDNSVPHDMMSVARIMQQPKAPAPYNGITSTFGQVNHLISKLIKHDVLSLDNGMDDLTLTEKGQGYYKYLRNKCENPKQDITNE